MEGLSNDPLEGGVALFSANQDLLRGAWTRIPAADIDEAIGRLQGEGRLPRPLSVHLDVTFRCTARCTHCAQWTWRSRPELDLERIDVLVTMLSHWGVRTVTLGGGNPLLHPHLDRIVRPLHRSGVRIGLITEGGVALSAQTRRMIDECVSWIRFSMDGSSADVHDRIRGNPGLFERTTSEIRALRAFAPAASVGLNFVVQRRNMHQLPQMIELANDLKVDVLQLKLPHGEDPRHRYVPTAAEWTTIHDTVAELAARPVGRVRTNLDQFAMMLASFDRTDVSTGRPVRRHYSTDGVHCFVPLFFLVIDARGDVYPCNYLQADTRAESDGAWQSRTAYLAGNVFDDGDQVLDRLGQLFRTIVHDLPASGHPECGSCTRFFQLNTALTLGRLERTDANPAAPPFL